MKVKKLVVVFMVFALSALLLTGCGGSKDAADPATDGSSAVATGEADKIIRYTMTVTPKLDPCVGSDLASASNFVNMYDTLVLPQSDGSVKPWLATDWTVSDDNLTWEFNIRKGVKFHSGNELTAADVAYSMNRIITIGEGYGYLFRGRIAEATAVDEDTVKFVCTQPYGPFLSTLVRLYILDSKLIEENLKDGDYGEKGDYGKAFLLEGDAGSGPYKLKEIKQNTYVWAEKFNDYWAGFESDNPDEYKCIGSNESVTVKTMMSRKELEIADHYQTAENTKAMGEMPGVKIASSNTGAIMLLTMNNQKAPTDDIHYRKALAYMIDYATINESIFPESVKANSVVPSILLGYNREMFPYDYNLEKAKEELALSKYAGQLEKYPLEVAWVAETPDREKLALTLQASAQQINLPINIVKTPWSSIVEKSANPTSTPNCVTVVCPPYYSEAGTTLESQIRSKSVGTWENCSWINNTELDKMIDDAIATIDVEQRTQKYRNIQKFMADIVPLIPVCEQPERTAYQASYVDWKAAMPDQLIPVMGYKYYMRNIFVYPDKK
ncbi:MAG: ABC transporter substrate-binding protein [Dehalobacterium sp.]